MIRLLAMIYCYTSCAIFTLNPVHSRMQGSWAIGLYVGSSPFDLEPVESVHSKTGDTGSQTHHASNPILTCASIQVPFTNFVADPFLFLRNEGFRTVMYLFFELKNNEVMRGEIGVARSEDKGVSWEYLGVGLREPWHLSYPYIFKHGGKIYMLPEGSRSGSLRLYEAIDFPLKWSRVSIIIDKPLVDASIVRWQGSWYILASDPTLKANSDANSNLVIYQSDRLLGGQWKEHAQNPIMMHASSTGARQAGRIIRYNSTLYRFGQNCQETYGKDIIAYRIDTLNSTVFSQTRINFLARRPAFHPVDVSMRKKIWNGARRHHVDVQRLATGKWLAVIDGDWQASNQLTKPLVRHAIIVTALWSVSIISFALYKAISNRSTSDFRNFFEGPVLPGIIICMKRYAFPSSLYHKLLRSFQRFSGRGTNV